MKHGPCKQHLKSTLIITQKNVMHEEESMQAQMIKVRKGMRIQERRKQKYLTVLGLVKNQTRMEMSF